MGFSKKIQEYFDNKGLNNRDISKIMDGYNESLVSRYLNSDNVSMTFVEKLIKYFPDIDLNYLLKDQNDTVSETREVYESNQQIIEEIENKLNELKNNLKR